ncbi:acyl-CoA dehydrogenase family protein [Sphingomonas sp. MMS24-JH45]
MSEGSGTFWDGTTISLLLSAYLTGVAQASTAMAVAYAGTREQFGQPIGAFQAVKHICADMATRAAAAEAQTFFAAATFGRGADDGAEVAAARLLAADAALANAKANIQVHGGMGFTAECDAHLLLKRAHLVARLGSDPAKDRIRLIKASPQRDI